MSEKIEPALSAEEWAVLATSHADYAIETAVSMGEFGKALAVANYALPDSDPRKITRAWVQEIRSEAEEYEFRGLVPNPGDALNAIADALESYLPPEPV